MKSTNNSDNNNNKNRRRNIRMNEENQINPITWELYLWIEHVERFHGKRKESTTWEQKKRTKTATKNLFMAFKFQFGISDNFFLFFYFLFLFVEFIFSMKEIKANESIIKKRKWKCKENIYPMYGYCENINSRKCENKMLCIHFIWRLKLM